MSILTEMLIEPLNDEIDYLQNRISELEKKKTNLKLFLISQNVNNGYDTYDSAVVAARTAEEASRIHPEDIFIGNIPGLRPSSDSYYKETWADYKDVCVTYIGEAADNIIKSVLCSSFNAG